MKAPTILALAASILAPSILASGTDSTIPHEEKQGEDVEQSSSQDSTEEWTVAPMEPMEVKWIAQASTLKSPDSPFDYMPLYQFDWDPCIIRDEQPHLHSYCCGNSQASAQLIRMLSTASTLDHRAYLLDMLEDVDVYSYLPQDAKQLTAKKRLGIIINTTLKIGSLTAFPPVWRNKVIGIEELIFKARLYGTVRECLETGLGINPVDLSSEDREQLFGLVRSLVTSPQCVDCPLGDELSLDSSISEIFKAVKSKIPRLIEDLSCMLEYYPEFVAANWCMRILGRPAFPSIDRYINTWPQFLLNSSFLRRHCISEDEQKKLLGLCNAHHLCRPLPLDYKGLVI